MPELWKIQRETDERQEEAQEMALEIEDHHERAATLAEAVAHMEAAQDAAASDRLEAVLQDAEEAERATRERLGELRAQRDAMLAENAQIRASVQESTTRKTEALARMPLLRQAMRAKSPDADVAGSIYERMEADLHDDLRRTRGVADALEEVRLKLEALDL